MLWHINMISPSEVSSNEKKNANPGQEGALHIFRNQIHSLNSFTSFKLKPLVTTRSQWIQMNKDKQMLNFIYNPPGNSLRLCSNSSSHSSLHLESYMHIVWLSGANICEMFIDVDVQLLSVLHNSDSWPSSLHCNLSNIILHDTMKVLLSNTSWWFVGLYTCVEWKGRYEVRSQLQSRIQLQLWLQLE